MNRQPRAVLFCRSNHGSARGIEAQERRCRAAAAAAGAAEDMITIVDQERGTSDLDRPAVAELRRLVQSGAVDLVVVDAPDRLSRRVGDLRAFTQEISRAGVRLLFVAP